MAEADQYKKLIEELAPLFKKFEKKYGKTSLIFVASTLVLNYIQDMFAINENSTMSFYQNYKIFLEQQYNQILKGKREKTNEFKR